MRDNKSADLCSLWLRLVIAFFFGFHFYWKLMNGFDATMHSLTMRGFPVPFIFTCLDMGTEILVIPFLVLGAYSRFCMITMLPLMLGVIGVYYPRGFLFISSGIEFPLMWLFMMIALIILGDGRYSIKLPHLFLDGRHPSTYRSLGKSDTAASNLKGARA